MNISVGAQWEAYIAEHVKSGRYLSASEVVRDGLRLLQEREELRRLQVEQLQRQIGAGLEALDTGDYVELDAGDLANYMEDVKARGRKRLAKRPADTP